MPHLCNLWVGSLTLIVVECEAMTTTCTQWWNCVYLTMITEHLTTEDRSFPKQGYTWYWDDARNSNCFKLFRSLEKVFSIILTSDWTWKTFTVNSGNEGFLTICYASTTLIQLWRNVYVHKIISLAKNITTIYTAVQITHVSFTIFHSHLQRPRFYCSAPRIITSDQF